MNARKASSKKARKDASKSKKRRRPRGPRPFWSGTVAFGLVSLPVGLFPATRAKAVSLRMVDDQGTRLTRRYFCSKEEKPLEYDELVRGYPLDKDRFVLVEDDELDALAPEKSQEIDLKRFVALSELDPMRFERAYFMTPEQGAIKAYRLLARAMEDSARAGIATFVMRGKEYLVAILADDGILRAEVLRFHDELRSPDDVGLPEPDKPRASDIQRFQAGIKKLMADDLDVEQLEDRQSQKIIALAKRKAKKNQDLVESGEPASKADAKPEPAVDLMEVIKRSLKEGHTPWEDEPAEGGKRRPARDSKRRASNKRVSKKRTTKKRTTKKRTTKKATSNKRRARKKDNRAALEKDTRDDLYERARALNIEGRSGMNKARLIDAILGAS